MKPSGVTPNETQPPPVVAVLQVVIEYHFRHPESSCPKTCISLDAKDAILLMAPPMFLHWSTPISIAEFVPQALEKSTVPDDVLVPLPPLHQCIVRFVTSAVCVLPQNLTVFVLPMSQSPSKVPCLILAPASCIRGDPTKGTPSRLPCSTVRTTDAIRSAEAFVNATRFDPLVCPGLPLKAQSSKTCMVNRVFSTAAVAA